ncbi:MAG: membrane protein insertase YidC [Deltaproteobacteria bacterium]|nr:membrane protein insertase YidC [Deltaproteobacteria bacterium]MBW2076018.1 membrane protein insertase YidC [Deltaproteobacteria bacterium]
MDKRTLLALVLSFIVFLVWSLLFGPKPAEKPPTPEQEQVQQPVPERTKPLGPQKELMLEAEARAADITVDTELYSALFSGSGPMIKGFKLKKYRSTVEKDSPLKELIHVNNKDGYGFNLGFAGQNIPNSTWAAFTVQKEGIVLARGDQPEELVYEWVSPQGVRIQTRFLFHAEKYAIDLTVMVNNGSEYVIDDALSLHLAHLPRATKKAYGVFEGMALLLDDKLKQIKAGKIEEKRFQGQIPWVAYEEPYFMLAIANENNTTLTAKGTTLPNGEIRISYLTPSLNVKPLERITENFTLYLGPRDLYVLKGLKKKLEKAINFGWFDIIAKPLLVTLRFFNKYVSNYGISIILLTVLVKILFWPLTRKSYQSMKEMRKLQPMMAKIREKYKNNKQEMQKQLMSLYKTYKINPMGGCLPMLVQIPVFFAFYRILPSSIELRHAPFVLWINDLSAPERLWSFPFKVPFMAPPYGIPVLTLLMGASMFLQQKMTPSPGDPAQAKMMMLLPIVFTFLFINFPSGLVLYWLVNNLLSIAQQYRINRQVG